MKTRSARRILGFYAMCPYQARNGPYSLQSFGEFGSCNFGDNLDRFFKVVRNFGHLVSGDRQARNARYGAAMLSLLVTTRRFVQQHDLLEDLREAEGVLAEENRTLKTARKGMWTGVPLKTLGPDLMEKWLSYREEAEAAIGRRDAAARPQATLPLVRGLCGCGANLLLRGRKTQRGGIVSSRPLEFCGEGCGSFRS
jgi:hypothetical protein